MSVFHVDSQQVSLAAATANQSSATIRAEVARMMSFLNGLQDTWGGSAAVSFQSIINQWQATQIQVEESLGAISTQLGQAANTYSEAESSAASLFMG